MWTFPNAPDIFVHVSAAAQSKEKQGEGEHRSEGVVINTLSDINTKKKKKFI